MENESTKNPEKQPKSSGRTAPRFGAFVTIAVSLLLLFGAASRVGKTPETLALFGIDNQAENRIKQEEERLRTALMIGSVPVRRDDVTPTSGSVHLDPDAMPPTRGDFDPETILSANSNNNNNNSDSNSGQLMLAIPHANESLSAMASPTLPENREPQATPKKNYRVKEGDTWVKVSRNTLGDPNRWREILAANPAASNGLRVGMDLTIPN